MFTTAHRPIRTTLTAVAATFVCTVATLAAIDSPAHAATARGFVAAADCQIDHAPASNAA